MMGQNLAPLVEIGLSYISELLGATAVALVAPEVTFLNRNQRVAQLSLIC